MKPIAGTIAGLAVVAIGVTILAGLKRAVEAIEEVPYPYEDDPEGAR